MSVSRSSMRSLYFYPRSPCGERRGVSRRVPRNIHFYPRSPCGERRRTDRRKERDSQISIHALLAESDFCRRPGMYESRYISIHALLAESDHPCPTASTSQSSFLSTLSLRRATPRASAIAVPTRDFYPRSPCGERPPPSAYLNGIAEFLSTLSLRRATPPGLLHSLGGVISIHALLAESDVVQLQCILGGRYFYPRSPCGERLTARIIDPTYGKISIHALLAESDTTFQKLMAALLQFLSTLSLRRATGHPEPGGNLGCDFYPRSPCGERPREQAIAAEQTANFYPRSPCGERP